MLEVFENNLWGRATRLDSDKLIPVELKSVGIVEEPQIEIKSYQSINDQEIEELDTILDWLFSFRQDLTALYNFIDNDPILKNLKERFRG